MKMYIPLFLFHHLFLLGSKNAINCEINDSKTQNKMNQNTSVIQTYNSTQSVLKRGLLILFFIATASVIVFWSLISTLVTPYKLHVINTICLDNLDKINGNNAEIQLDKLNQSNQINVDNSNRINRNDAVIVPIKINQSNNLNPKLPTCQKEKLVNKTFIDISTIKDMSAVEKTLSKRDNDQNSVEPGGWYEPKDCKPSAKVAIIIPYRNRFEHLKIFLRYMHPFLQRQQLYYRVFVVEQIGQDRFNRASLLNIGFKEALKITDFDCFVFHDVDHLPETDRNFYGCPKSPMHLAVSVDKWHYELPYHDFFGGVNSFSRVDYEKINGMSNMFWGWGGEDDDVFYRTREKKMTLNRPSMTTGRYTTLTENHFRSSDPDPNREKLLGSSTLRMDFDGLNTLKFRLVEKEEKKLYTLIRVELKREMYRFLLQEILHQTV